MATKNKKSDPTYKCKYCGVETKKSKLIHMNENNGVSLKCPSCKRTVTDNMMMDEEDE